MEPAVSGRDDVIGVGFPDEWLRVLCIVFADEAVDGGLKIDNGTEDAVLEPAPGEFGEEALDGVEPGAGCWGEMEGPARVAVEPGADLVFFVSGVIVEDHMDCLVRRHLALDAVEEADELLMAVALHVLCDDRAVQHVEGSEERRCAVPLVVACHRAGAALLHWQAGWVRSRAWNCDFSSTDSTTAWAGGSTYKPTMVVSFSAKAGSLERAWSAVSDAG